MIIIYNFEEVTIMNEKLFNFLNQAYSPYHNVNYFKNELLRDGFKELKEDEPFSLEKGGQYFVIRNLTSLLAFKVGKNIEENTHFQMVASHSDSPVFKIKEHVFTECGGFQKLIVEPYGGMIHSCWLDKPLGIGGRIIIQKGNSLVSKLVNLDNINVIIPNLAIHMNREINNGYKYNPQSDLSPIIGEACGENLLEKKLNESLLEGEKLISYDLYLYNKEEATFLGFNNELIGAPKLDDLMCAFTTFEGFLEASNDNIISLYALFDNEEVGSTSINGANSNFLDSVTKRIYLSFFNDSDKYFASLASSSLLSADNAHAIHPNRPDVSENNSPVEMNKGVVVKHNANMHYCSDALSTALVKKLAEDNKLNIQEYFNRSDIRGGSTLGNISISHVSILSVDIGLAQLAMHSNYETIGAKDYLDMVKLVSSYMKQDIKVKEGNIIF